MLGVSFSMINGCDYSREKKLKQNYREDFIWACVFIDGIHSLVVVFDCMLQFHNALTQSFKHFDYFEVVFSTNENIFHKQISNLKN